MPGPGSRGSPPVLARTCAANSGSKHAAAASTAGRSYTLTLTSKAGNRARTPACTECDDITTS